MAMTHDEVVSTLNDLIRICKDGEEGFRTSAEAMKNPALQSVLEEYSRQRASFAAELQSEVGRLGGEAATGSDVRGALHRTWLNIRTAVQGGDETAILSEAERGEDRARDAYREALQKDLPTDTRQVVERQYAEIQKSHDRVRDLRDEAKQRKAA